MIIVALEELRRHGRGTTLPSSPGPRVGRRLPRVTDVSGIVQVQLVRLIQQAAGDGRGVTRPADVDSGGHQRSAARVRARGGVVGILPVAQQLGAGGQVFGDAVRTGMRKGLSNTRIPVTRAGAFQLQAVEHAGDPDQMRLLENLAALTQRLPRGLVTGGTTGEDAGLLGSAQGGDDNPVMAIPAGQAADLGRG